jgi:peptidoglycan/xylan/chitin deacetylase (PgdA/CDA1 family)
VAYERIEELARRNGVPLPVLPPAKYRAMTWDEVRQCEAAGVQFAPHTVSHPILANTTAAHSERDIAGSWRRVREECRSPVPLFAYPNGQPRDFNGRERELLSRSGIAAAVTTSPGHVDKTTPPYDLPRWDLTPDPVRMGQVLSGIEDAKADVRAFLGRLG